LTKIVACRREEARFGYIGEFGVQLRRLELADGVPAFSNVGKGDDDARGQVILGRIWRKN
jgi:hypothetical protein